MKKMFLGIIITLVIEIIVFLSQNYKVYQYGIGSITDEERTKTGKQYRPVLFIGYGNRLLTKISGYFGYMELDNIRFEGGKSIPISEFRENCNRKTIGSMDGIYDIKENSLFKIIMCDDEGGKFL